MKKLVSLALMVVLAALSLPLGVFAQDDLTETYSSGGYTFQHPAGWEFQDMFGILIGTNDPTVLESNMESLVGDQAIITMTSASGASIEVPEGATPLDALEAAQEDMTGGEGITVGTPSELTVGGKPAAQISITQADAIDGLLVVIDFEGDYLVFLGGTAVGKLEAYQPTFLAMLETLQFDASQVADLGDMDFGGSLSTLDLTKVPPAVTGTGNFIWQLQTPNNYDDASFGTQSGIDVAADDTIYIADGSNGILVVSPDGTVQKIIQNADIFSYDDVAVGADNTLWLTDSFNTQIVQLDMEGNILQAIGSEGSEEGQFSSFSPRILEVGPDGNIYTFDSQSDETGSTTTGRIQVFSPDGQVVSVFPTNQPEDFGFSFDIALAIGPDGKIYAGDSFNGIRVFDLEGNILQDKLGEQALNFASLSNLDVDPNGNIYLITSEPKFVILDSAGTLVAELAATPQEYSDEPTPFELGQFSGYPSGLSLLSTGEVIVLDTNYGHNQIVRVKVQ